MELVQDTPAVFRPRRFSDAVSPLNETMFDAARQTALCIQHLDHLGIKVKEVIAAGQGERPTVTILVEYAPACRELKGRVRSGGLCCDLMAADVFGCQVQWSQPKEAA